MRDCHRMAETAPARSRPHTPHAIMEAALAHSIENHSIKNKAEERTRSATCPRSGGH